MIKAVFCALVAIFIVMVSFFVAPVPVFMKRMLFPYMYIFSIVFFILGLTLIFLTLKKQVKGRFKNFLILMGVSSAGFLVSVLLHNFIYGLFAAIFGVGFWDKIGLGDEPIFFFLAIFVCPIGFLIGVVGSLAFFIRRISKQEKRK